MPRPTLHVLAGPNGAGKTTLYETAVKAFTAGVEFINADRLAFDHFGHLATTAQESETGQHLAEARRSDLMSARRSLVTEPTFSHPSKLDLVPEAKIRERYLRNQALIREAVRIADRAYVFDNSELDRPHRRILSFMDGRVNDAVEPLPAWAAVLYAAELTLLGPQSA